MTLAMSSRRAIRGVLGNFLGTYTSRNSDYEGYWLFGFLLPELGSLRIDLLAKSEGGPVTPQDVAIRLAEIKFRDQVRKADVSLSCIGEAWLSIRKQPEPITRPVNGRPCQGHTVCFTVEVIMDNGKRYEKQKAVFVAPHIAAIEIRCTIGGDLDSRSDLR
jgi:hypothetical protein